MLKTMSGAMRLPIPPGFPAGTIVTGGSMSDAKLMRHAARACRAGVPGRKSAAFPSPN